MTVEDRGVIDFVVREADEIVLVISDHLGWSDEEQHLRVLQDKLLDYVDALIENELEILKTNPDLRRRIDVVVKHEPVENFRKLLAAIEAHARSASNVSITWRHWPSTEAT